jgi:site-specific DNA recombinase
MFTTRDLFEAVQARLTEQTNNHRATRMASEALLTGRIFDDRGNLMSPSHARKGSVVSASQSRRRS